MNKSQRVLNDVMLKRKNWGHLKPHLKINYFNKQHFSNVVKKGQWNVLWLTTKTEGGVATVWRHQPFMEPDATQNLDTAANNLTFSFLEHFLDYEMWRSPVISCITVGGCDDMGAFRKTLSINHLDICPTGGLLVTFSILSVITPWYYMSRVWSLLLLG